MAVAWVIATAGILVRMWIGGRPPVTNLYSSALFIGWGSVGLCLILERIYKNGIGTVAGGSGRIQQPSSIAHQAYALERRLPWK